VNRIALLVEICASAGFFFGVGDEPRTPGNPAGTHKTVVKE
jgi:hypothetical protein